MRLNSVLISIVFMVGLATEIITYNILVAVPFESESIHHFFTKISKHLVAANHSVTLITNYDASFEHPNFTHVNVYGKGAPKMKANFFEMTGGINSIKELQKYVISIGTIMWQNKDVLAVWENRHTFDAFIMAAYVNDFALPFLMNFTGQFILISNPGLEYFTTAFMGNWLPPSVVPMVYLPYDENMSFFERLANVVSLIAFYHYNAQVNMQQQLAFLRPVFPDIDDLLSYYDRASLTLINSHPALDNPVPLLPNQVEIGTLNAHPPEPLPQDLEDFMSSSGDHGVIYFSLGSVAQSTDIPMRAKLAFVEAFARLPQKVVWKYEGDDLDLPPNVLTRKWLPQQDILGHPKTRVFISHCGIMGTQELKYHGVPVLAVPIAFDQHRNAARLIRKKLGLLLAWDTLTADDVVESINTLVNDTSYSLRLKTLSGVLRDQKESPAERAVWWIEYVIRHRGAPHLQYPGKRLHFLQYICADVILFLAVSFYLVYRVARRLVCLVIGLFRAKGKAKGKATKQKRA